LAGHLSITETAKFVRITTKAGNSPRSSFLYECLVFKRKEFKRLDPVGKYRYKKVLKNPENPHWQI